jgi:hypothetical protein
VQPVELPEGRVELQRLSIDEIGKVMDGLRFPPFWVEERLIQLEFGGTSLEREGGIGLSPLGSRRSRLREW